MSSVSYNFRVDENLKNQSFEVFKRLGISPAQAIKMFLKEAAETNSLPLRSQAMSDATPKTWAEFFDKYADDVPDDDFLVDRQLTKPIERDLSKSL